MMTGTAMIGGIALSSGASLDDAAALRAQLARQVAHWRAAVVTIDDPENFASASAWAGLEGYLNVAIRRQLQQSVERLRLEAEGLQAELAAARSEAHLQSVQRRLLAFRRRFTQTETVLDFYGDAVNTRTSHKLAGLLRALDIIAERSMAATLKPLGRQAPPVLTYIDKGMGASILRAGLRLWDPDAISPAAAVKITRHNLYRPTSLIHETGHQIAHLLGWTGEAAACFERELAAESPVVARAWAGWASEVVADAFAFAHTGYAAVATLHDVIAGEDASVMRLIPGDPHPVAYIRVLLGVQMCVRFFGAGPWDDLARSWQRTHPLDGTAPLTGELLARSLPLLQRIVEICLLRQMRAFSGRPLAALVDPTRVRPDALARLAYDAGAALYTSQHWITQEPLRLLALSGLRAAMEPERSAEIAAQYEAWMLRLGSLQPAIA
jgi:hypothetical protein